MNKRLRRRFTCPAEFAFYVLGGKWRGAIIAHLGGGPMRYSELRRVIPQLSDKVLATTLRQLESLRIIERAASRTESGPIPLYCLTAKGQALSPMLRLACAWARTHATEYGVDFLHGPPCGPGALKAEFAAIVAEATRSSEYGGIRLMDS
jgi:DNA-binding HxlR family transcriptional regulator